MAAPTPSEATLLALPSEILTSILEYVFDQNFEKSCLKSSSDGAITVNQGYSAAALLSTLLTSRQIYIDGRLPALKRTHFLVTNLYIRVPERLSRLSLKQQSALRSITVTADSRHFRALGKWGNHAFDMPTLDLDCLTVVLHQASTHYLFDFTSDIAKLLRRLQRVKRLVFVRNRAHVKGSFRTWCNRLIGIILKIDHHERYDARPPKPEATWWKWRFDGDAATFCIDALPSKEMVDEETYMLQTKPLVEELMVSIEKEEWNPDPRARNGT